MLTDLLSNISLGLSIALSPSNLGFCVLGGALGVVVGVIPGIGALTAIAMLFPITFYLDPASALVMLGGIYYGTTYGGSTTSILLNLPGTPANAVTCLEGYPLAKAGRAGPALFMATLASFVGGSIGILIMMLFSPAIADLALDFGPAEYFALMVMGLVAASVVSIGSPVKSISMVILGILIGEIGMDTYTATPRLTFGMMGLMDGVSIIALAMGLFGVAEVISSIRATTVGHGTGERINVKSVLPSREDIRRSSFPILRGTGIGSFFGALPGTGPTIAAFIAYAMERKIAREPQRFGHGAIEGVVGPESANNAADQTAFIPTLTLGIPGSPTMALILGVLMIHGVSPGPTMMSTRPDVFWGLVMSFWIGNVILAVLNVPLISVWIRVLLIPYHILYPAILMLVCIGVFAVHNSTFDVMTVIVFAAFGYGMRVLDFPAAPLLLGFVLGPLMEDHLRRAMLLSRGSFEVFFTQPLSLTFILISVLLLLWGAWSAFRPATRNG